MLQVVPSTSPKLAMKCLTVNDQSCFGGAKASLKLFCFKSFTQTQGSFVWPLPITGGKRAFLGPYPFVLSSFNPPCLIAKTPPCVDPALLSGTTAPEGLGRPHELQGQAKFCSLWSPLSPAQQSLVTCHMERKI